MASLTLRVTPEQLIAKANIASKNIKDMRVALQEIDNLIKKTGGYWIGPASNTLRNSYTKTAENAETVMKRLEEHPTDLLKMAGVYKEAEEVAKQVSNVLPKSVL